MNTTDPTRRYFLKAAAVFGGSIVGAPHLLARIPLSGQDTNQEICERTFSLAIGQSLQKRPIGEAVAALGRSFMGTPYVANTLEAPGAEHLVINLQGLDCVTFVENALSLARCVKLGTTTFAAFKNQLQLIRYRDGRIDEYPSRLHYFTDWIHNNETKQVVRSMTRELGGLPFTKLINFMSTHVASYRQLAHAEFLKAIQHQEAEINSRKHFFIPKENLATVESGIRDGDIIGITTSMQGMDIAHTGLAVWADGTLRFLHAPLSGGKVEITGNSLSGYLNRHEQQTGIMVARPLDPPVR